MTDTPTKADLARFDALHQIGCIACRQDKRLQFGVDIHHCLSGGFRRGHQFTLPLCVWHHRAIPHEGRTREQMRFDYGPSVAYFSRDFHARYGSDDALLAAVNALIGAAR